MKKLLLTFVISITAATIMLSNAYAWEATTLDEYVIASGSSLAGLAESANMILESGDYRPVGGVLLDHSNNHDAFSQGFILRRSQQQSVTCYQIADYDGSRRYQVFPNSCPQGWQRLFQ